MAALRGRRRVARLGLLPSTSRGWPPQRLRPHRVRLPVPDPLTEARIGRPSMSTTPPRGSRRRPEHIRTVLESYGSAGQGPAAGRGCLLCDTAIEHGHDDPSAAGRGELRESVVAPDESES